MSAVVNKRLKKILIEFLKDDLINRYFSEYVDENYDVEGKLTEKQMEQLFSKSETYLKDLANEIKRTL